MAQMTRRSRVSAPVIHTTLGTCTAIELRNASGAAVLIPTGITEITYYACDTVDGTFAIVNNVGTAGVDAVAADKWHVLPAELFPLPFLKIKSTSGTGTATACIKQ